MKKFYTIFTSQSELKELKQVAKNYAISFFELQSSQFYEQSLSTSKRKTLVWLRKKIKQSKEIKFACILEWNLTQSQLINFILDKKHYKPTEIYSFKIKNDKLIGVKK